MFTDCGISYKKSSFSIGNGACVEVGTKFRTSSFCGHPGCVEVDTTSIANMVYVRDSKLGVDSPVHRVASQTWTQFVWSIKEGCVDESILLIDEWIMFGNEENYVQVLHHEYGIMFQSSLSLDEDPLEFTFTEWEKFLLGVNNNEFDMNPPVGVFALTGGDTGNLE